MIKYHMSSKFLKQVLLFFLFSMIAFCFTASSHAFNVTSSGVQLRNYSNPSGNHVRVYFGLENDESFQVDNISWTVTSPDFEVTTHSSMKNCELYTIYGNYDENQGFVFGSIEQDDCYFGSIIADYPETDVRYTITITNQNGVAEPQEEVIEGILFDPERDPVTGEIILPPMVDSSTFKFSIETVDNQEMLRMEWDLPGEMGDNDMKLLIENTADGHQAILLTLPNTMNYALIPLSVFQQFENMNGGLFSVRTNTPDKKVRCYSDSVTVNFRDLIETDAEPVVLASYSFSGTGFLYTRDYNADQQLSLLPADIQGTISLVTENVIFSETCWKTDLTIQGMEPMSILLKDSYNGACSAPYVDNELVNLSTEDCWGEVFGCTDDPTRPGENGWLGLSIYLKTSDFTGLITVGGANFIETEEGTKRDFEFLGDMALDLTQ